MKRPFQGLAKNFIIVVLIFLFISAVFALFSPPPAEEEKISLSKLTQDINRENIEKIQVSGDELTVFYKDETRAISKKEAETALTQSLINYGVSPDKLGRVDLTIEPEATGWTDFASVFLIFLPILFIVGFLWMFLRQSKAGAMQAFNFSKTKARIFGAEGHPKEKVNFDDVAGLKESKEELKEIVEFLRTPKKFLGMGAKIPRGVLLLGPPGCGKTLLARATAGESNVPFFSIAGSEFIEMFVGVGSGRVRSLFQEAKKHNKSIIFIDELDAIGRTRGVGMGGGHDEREQTLNQILVEMDGFERDSKTIVLAASVTGDTPTLVQKNGEYKLLPVSDVVDPYYKNNEENIEKEAKNLNVLGFERKIGRAKNNLYFQNSSFKKVRSVFRHKVNEIYEVKYAGGKIKTTGNHSLFVRTPQGLKQKLVSEMKPGDILVNLPYKANRTSKELCENRGHKFPKELRLELQVWQPLFQKFEQIEFAYQYALSHVDEASQTQLGKELGFSQRTIGKWQQGICEPRYLSKNYYQHKNSLPAKVKVTPELSRLFGYYVAEGYARKEIDFCFSRAETIMIKDVQTLMKKIFNLRASKIKYATPGAVNIVYNCKPLAEFFAYHCGKGAKNKHIPQFLFNAPKEYFIEFLSSYASGDGYMCPQGRLELTSVSKQLIVELNWLSRMHGFKSYISRFTAKKNRKISPNGKPLKATNAYRLGFGKTQNPLSPRKGKPNVLRPVVKSIKRLPYQGYVYDFCGCENEAFFGGENPVLLHNTNRPDILDPALLRPGRFDRQITLSLPSIEDREAILKIHSKGKPLAKKANLREIAERTPGFSGADLENLLNEAAILAARKNKTIIDQGELTESIEKVLLGPERKSYILSKKEKEISAYHEAGHALVATFTGDKEPVRKISIVARGAAGGYTIKTPSEEKRMKNRSDFIADIASLLGGYCAERQTFGEVSTGASNDLERASYLARKLIKEFGMSKKLGPIVFGEKKELKFLGKQFDEEKNYSEKIAEQIDQEVFDIFNIAQKEAEKVLKNKKQLLEKIAQTLIKKETLEKAELEKLLKPQKKPGKLKKRKK